MKKQGKDLNTLSLDEKRKIAVDAINRNSKQIKAHKQNVEKGDYVGFSAILSDFAPITLTPPIPQQKLLDTMAWLMAKATCIKNNVDNKQSAIAIFQKSKEMIRQYGVNPQLISQRETNIASAAYNAVSDDAFTDVKASVFTQHQMPESLSFNSIPLFDDYAKDPRGALLDRRMSLYESAVDSIFDKAYADDKTHTAPNDLIHVTCSGYLAPSPAENLVARKLWQDTIVTHSYHMGCYGSIPAIRMGIGFLAASHLGIGRVKSRIDIVHSEFLSLHSNMLDQSPRQIISASLFGDGFIKYSIYSADSFANSGKRGFKILGVKESIIPNSIGAMSWNLSSHNFRMHLSKKIPVLIGKNIISFVNSLLTEASLDFSESKSNMIFAIHPGGPKILDMAKVALRLDEDQIRQSRSILFEHGNMSSATIPYILSKIINDDSVLSGTKILCLAFGPGLTAAGTILEKI